MESVGLLSIIRVANGTKTKSAGAKIFFADPAFYPVLRGNLGTAREALVAALCSESGWFVEASRDETVGDVVLTRYGTKGTIRIDVEVGGSSKKIKNWIISSGMTRIIPEEILFRSGFSGCHIDDR